MRLADSGIKQIEAGSFVNPKAVPQMADTNGLFEQIDKRPGVRYRALWLDPKGLERALANGNVDIAAASRAGRRMSRGGAVPVGSRFTPSRCHCWKFSRNPGSCHVRRPSSPAADSVTHAVRMSAPPKQMLVGWLSGILSSSTNWPSGRTR